MSGAGDRERNAWMLLRRILAAKPEHIERHLAQAREWLARQEVLPSDFLRAAGAGDPPSLDVTTPIDGTPVPNGMARYWALCQHLFAIKSRLTDDECTVLGAALTEYADLLRERAGDRLRLGPAAPGPSAAGGAP